MERSRGIRRLAWYGLGLLGTSVLANAASAQTMPPYGGQTIAAGVTNSTRSGPLTGNPFANPAMNPYLNPALNAAVNPMVVQQNLSPGQAALYLMAAQQANGGIGSGKLGGARGNAAPAPKEATAPARSTSSNVPGARASTYFNRTNSASVGAASYYSRQTRHFPNNSR